MLWKSIFPPKAVATPISSKDAPFAVVTGGREDQQMQALNALFTNPDDDAVAAMFDRLEASPRSSAVLRRVK